MTSFGQWTTSHETIRHDSSLLNGGLSTGEEIIQREGNEVAISFLKGMGHRTLLRRLFAGLKRWLGIEARVSREDFCQLLQLAEAIVDHGRMLQSYPGTHCFTVVVEVADLSFPKPYSASTVTILHRKQRKNDYGSRYFSGTHSERNSHHEFKAGQKIIGINC
jgi:hypothetical protein